MKKLLFTLIALAAFSAAHAQDAIDIDQMDGFHSIRITGNLSVEIVATPHNPAMHVDLMGNDVKRFDWSIKDSVLNISFSVNSKSNATKLTVWTNTPIRGMVVRRADVQLNLLRPTLLCDVTLREGARLTAMVDCMDLRLSMFGRSVAEVYGKAKYQTIKVRRSSALEASKVTGQSVEVVAQGGSEVYVYASERAILTSRNRSSLFYDGNPAIIRTHITAPSTINSIGAR
ncbi:MAG: DUF2807 domain-containing protein [Rikenellaceae bacterium]|nr:DUF2807 domain-containing protein [Rikenellaceae bacterium]